VELPEKQGLKQPPRAFAIPCCILVAVELPEKQGLKLLIGVSTSPLQYSCRITSRKTR